MVLYFYRFTLDRVIDGDTVSGTFDLGFNMQHKTRIRLLGVDTPETWRPLTEAERVAGIATKEYLAGIIGGKSLFCYSQKLDVYGRALGVLYYEHGGVMVSVNDLVKSYLEENQYTKVNLRK